MSPERIGSLFMMAYTRRGWYIILNCMAHPLEFMKVTVNLPDYRIAVQGSRLSSPGHVPCTSCPVPSTISLHMLCHKCQTVVKLQCQADASPT